jgi:hypothetical protein
MRVTVRTLKQGWSAEIDVPDGCLVGELRAACARAATISPPARCKLVLRGAALADDALVAPLKPGDTVLVAARPAETPPSPGGASGGVNPGGLFRRRVEAGIAASERQEGVSSSDSDDDDARTARGETPPLVLSRPRLFLYGVLVRKMRAPAWFARASIHLRRVGGEGGGVGRPEPGLRVPGARAAVPARDRLLPDLHRAGDEATR